MTLYFVNCIIKLIEFTTTTSNKNSVFNNVKKLIIIILYSTLSRTIKQYN